MSEQPDHEHKWVHIETKKVRATRGSIGYGSGEDWRRTDLFFCEHCLQQKSVTRTESWVVEKEPEWW